MSLAPPAPSNFTPAGWLKTIGRPWRRLTLLTSALIVADTAPAAGFALGVAMTVAHIHEGLTAIAPWLALAAGSLVARALVGQGATDQRRWLLADLFRGGGRSPAHLTAAVEGVDALDGYFARFLPMRIGAAISPLMIIGLAAVASPVSAGILLFTLLPFILGMALAGTAAAGESRRQFQALERLSGLFVDRIRALPAILAFDAAPRATAEVASASDELGRRTARVMRIAFVSSGVLEFFSALSVALIAVYCGFNLLRLLPFPVPETLDLPRAFFVLALAPEVYQPLRRLAAAYHDRQAAEAAAPALAVAEPRTLRLAGRGACRAVPTGPDRL